MLVRLAERRSECVAVTQEPTGSSDPPHVVRGSFGATPGQVVVQLARRGRKQLRRYRHIGGSWKSEGAMPAAAADRESLSVSLRQDLNTSPVLWVEDGGGHGKKLWDSAPQLSSMALGEASVGGDGSMMSMRP